MFNTMAHYKSLLPVYMAGLVSGKYTLQQAAESTGYHPVYLCNLKKRYLTEGSLIFEHQGKGRIAANATSEFVRRNIAAIYAKDYQDVNFSYFRKCLSEFYDIQISAPTLKHILNDFGMKSPEARKTKKKKPARRPRIRRECEGDMIQIDGTPYQWFYKTGDNNRYCLVGAIDDATGKITGLYMTEFECLYGYLEILRQTCNNYGVPREIYSDRAAIFCRTPRKSEHLDQWEQLSVIHGVNTQFQRVLEELHIRQILAWSPEAKGRVERMWRTIQGQLPQFLYNHKVKTVEEANKILPKYIAEFNASYSVQPAIDDPFWIDPPDNLDHILQARISRTTDRCGVFSFHSYKFAILSEYDIVCRNFELCISERGIYAYLNSKYYNVQLLDEHLYSGLGETMPIVVQNIIYRYMFAFAKEHSC